ncbi:unnamed protein product [Chironomus riparius]|uniref:FLYWCH-type domain-containing protein n=1 Tax=Chironomus riparius TaxID=315576 RepID=A0A9N9WWQ2_9DIPT|nr:unnamed protein product [Chironomus riparius]
MYTVSNKGKLILVLNGYEFYKEKERKDKCFWVCRRRFTHKCKARVLQNRTENKIELRNTNHSHSTLR